MSVPQDVLSQLGIDLDLEDGDLITDAIVLCKVSRYDGGTSLVSRTSNGMDFITYRGMIAMANDAATDTCPECGDE